MADSEPADPRKEWTRRYQLTITSGEMEGMSATYDFENLVDLMDFRQECKDKGFHILRVVKLLEEDGVHYE